MISSRIQIGDGPILDCYEAFGLIFMEADARTEAPAKSMETTSYAEEAGEHTDTRTVQDAFDYKVRFLIEAPNNNMENANVKIAEFNRTLYTQQTGTDVREYERVTFYNDYNRVKVSGVPKPIAEPTDFYRRRDGAALDCVRVELEIRVDNPSECDFSTQSLSGEAPTDSLASMSAAISELNRKVTGLEEMSEINNWSTAKVEPEDYQKMIAEGFTELKVKASAKIVSPSSSARYLGYALTVNTRVDQWGGSDYGFTFHLIPTSHDPSEERWPIGIYTSNGYMRWSVKADTEGYLTIIPYEDRIAVLEARIAALEAASAGASE